MRLTISMPVHNEEGSIVAVLERARAVLDRLDGDGEILVVDDGSDDETPLLVREQASQDSRIRVETLPENRGIAVFNRRMIDGARGDWVLFISSDGEFAPEEAPRFLDIAEEQQADAVLGVRKEKRYTPYRRLISWCFNALVWLSFGRRFQDVGSMRLLRRSVFQPIPLYCQSAFLNAERILAGARRGAVIVETLVDHHPRTSGRGRGSRPSKVLAATLDLAATRLRWFRFRRYYTP